MGGQGRAPDGAADNPFWDFSLAVYDRAGVAAACLALQDRHGIDVNVLLFCAWAGTRGHALRPGEMAKLLAESQPWQKTVVMPLRALRRRLTDWDGAPESPVARLRSRIKAAELEAEAVEQQMLLAGVSFAADEGVPSVSGANMIAYLAALGIGADVAEVAELAAVIRGCYPHLTPRQAASAVAG